MDDQTPKPSGPIDWGSPKEPEIVWEPEPEEVRSRRRWLVPVLLLLVVAGGGVALALATRSGGGRSRGPFPAALQVRSLSATVISPVEIALDWSAAGDAEQYVLYRDGELLVTIRAPNLQYRDISVSPDSTYEYAIEAIDASGRHSDRATESVTTPPPPPLAEARLEGTWEVTLTYVEENYTNRNKGDRERETWEFIPRCDAGACDVRVNLFLEEQKRTVLNRTNRLYRGKGTANLDRCERVLLATTITIKVTVTEADFVDGVWRATRLTGRHETDSAAALSCQAGHGERTVKGTLEA
jgi:hypothetical protein